MIVDSEVSLAQMRKEIAECKSENYGWSFSEIDEANLTFQVTMTANDGEPYIIQIQFENYRLWPLLIDFVDPITKQVGVRTAYPFSASGFFNKERIAICHPCNRKAYQGYTGLHADWGDPSGWLNNPSISSLKSLKEILWVIYCRITNDQYNGRMEKRSA